MQYFKLSNYIVEPEMKIAKRIIFSDENTVAFILNIAEGESLPEHTHFNCTVLLKVIKGQADVLADGEPVAIDQGNLLQLDGAEKMSVTNTGLETLILYVTISPLPPSKNYIENVDF